jgi:flagellar basal-body rod protein FlgB
MDLNKIPLLEAMTKRMSWLGERTSVLAQNVANADTPGYTAKDVDPPSFAELVSGQDERLPMATTEPGHITPVSDAGSFKIVSQKTSERSLNGNSVQLEDQMMKISDNSSDYALTTSLYRQQLGLIKTALGHGSSS